MGAQTTQAPPRRCKIPPLDEPHDRPPADDSQLPGNSGRDMVDARHATIADPVELPALETHFAPGSQPAALRPLYDAGARMVTRDFFMVDRVLVNEFTAQCGLGCPDALSDGDVGLDSWRIELDDAGRIGQLEHIDRILIGNVFEAAFDSTTDQSPSLIFKDGQILRNTRALNALPFQEGQRGIHLIEFDAETGAFGAVSDGVESATSLLEPLYLKRDEVRRVEVRHFLATAEFVTQPFVQSIDGGHHGFGSAVFNPVFDPVEMGALAVDRNFNAAEHDYWVNNGQRLLTYFGALNTPKLLYTSARDRGTSTFADISQRLAQTITEDYADAFWADRAGKLHRKRKHLIHTKAPITGLWNDMPAAVVVDKGSDTVDIQTFDSDRADAAAAFYDTVITSSLLEPDVVSMTPAAFTEHAGASIEPNLLMDALTEMMHSSTPVTVGDLLGDGLGRSIEREDEPLTVGDWLVREFTHAFQARVMALPTAGVQSAERDLSRAVLALLLQGESLSMPALTQRVREGLAEETDGLNEREERQRLAQRLIRPYSDFSDEMLRPLGDLIDDFVDDPISGVVGEAVGLANGLYEAIIALSGGSVSAPECGLLPDNASAFARGMFGVQGAGLDESNIAFIEALKLGEYEGQTNYSFSDRMHHLLESARSLDESMARPLVESIAEIAGFDTTVGRDVHLVRDYGDRLDFKGLLVSLGDAWFRTVLTRQAPELFERSIETLKDAHPDADTVGALVDGLNAVDAVFAYEIADSLQATLETPDTARQILSGLLARHPLIEQGQNRDISIGELLVRRVVLNPNYVGAISTFIESELRPYIEGWVFNGGIESVVTDAEKATRDDCLATWLSTLYVLEHSLPPGSGVAETVRVARFGLREAATYMRRTLYIAGVGGVVSPLVQRHRRVSESFILNLAPSSPQVFELGPLFEGDVVWVESVLNRDRLTLMARVENDGQAHMQVATVYPDGRVETHHLGVMGDDYFGVAQNGDTILYAQSRGLKTALMAFSLRTGTLRTVGTYDNGVLTGWTPIPGAHGAVMRLRHEPFDGPMTTHHEGDQAFHNGRERTQDGMLFIATAE